MSIMTIETTITRKYLFGKSKSDLAYMYLELLERAVQAEAERDAAKMATKTLDSERTMMRVAMFGGKAEYIKTLQERAEQAEADARALAERVFETEILTDSEIEIVARYIQREQMERAGYLK